MKIYVPVVMAFICAAPLVAGCTGTSVHQQEAKVAAQPVSYDKPGFVTELKGGRLWVFRQGSKHLEEFRKHGELLQQVIRPGAGPNGITLKAPDTETINDYLKAK